MIVSRLFNLSHRTYKGHTQQSCSLSSLPTDKAGRSEEEQQDVSAVRYLYDTLCSRLEPNNCSCCSCLLDYTTDRLASALWLMQLKANSSSKFASPFGYISLLLIKIEKENVAFKYVIKYKSCKFKSHNSDRKHTSENVYKLDYFNRLCIKNYTTFRPEILGIRY